MSDEAFYPAFPSHGSMGEVQHEGMSLRDYFAAKGMQAIVAATCGDFVGGRNEFAKAVALTASQSFQIADAMLKARGGE